MIRLLKFLLTGSWHVCQWEEIAKHRVDWLSEGKDTGTSSMRYHQKCKHCGNIKHTDV